MTIGRFGKNFISRSSELIHTPRLRTPATQVFRSIENSFTNHPFSTHFSKSAQFPFSSNLSTFKTSQLTPTRNFSTSSKETKTPPTPSLIEESLRKISEEEEKEEEDPTKIREIIQSLPLNLRKDLALALVKKTPKIVVDNIQVFEIEDEKTRIELFRSAAYSDNHGYLMDSSWRKKVCTEFKNFNIKDRDFLVKVAPFFFNCFKTLEPIFKMLDITDPETLERAVLHISEKKPRELIGHLKPLALSESVLKEIISKIIPNIETVNQLSNLIIELPMLGIKDQAFIEKIILFTADKSPRSLAGNLQNLHLSKEFLKEIIPKIIPNIKNTEYLGILIVELPMLGIEDQSFIENIVLITADKSPESLAGNLHALHLSKEFLKTIITHMVTNTSIDYALRELIKELPELLPEDPTFIEKTTLDVLEKNRYALTQNLQPLNLKEEVVKQIISKLVEPYISENDANTMADADTLETPLYIKIRENLADTLETPLYIKIRENLFTLVKDDQPFVESILLKISKYCPHAISGNLKDLKVENKEILNQIILNIIPFYSGYPDSLIEDLSALGIQEAKFLISITAAIIQQRREFEQSSLSYSSLMKKLTKQDDKTNLPFFVQKLRIEDLTLRKDVIKTLIQENPRKVSLAIKLLGFEEPVFFEETLKDILTTTAVSNKTLAALVEDESLSDKITPSLFLHRWNFLGENKLKSTEVFLDLLQRPEIQESLKQVPSTPFKNNLLYTLALLDKNPNISPQDKLDKLLEICDLKAAPSLAELTGNFILFDMSLQTTSGYPYLIRVEKLIRLGIQNPAFLEKAVLSMANTHPDVLVDVIKHFNISNMKVLENIGVTILSNNPSYFSRYKDKLNLSKTSVLNILIDYGNNLYADKKSLLPPPVLTEIFSQITKYPNKPLSEIYLAKLLHVDSIENKDYQESFAYFTIPKKTKNSAPVTIHKILPTIYLASWDSQIRKKDDSSRQVLSDFFSNSEIRKILRNQVQYPLTQTLLFTLKDLDKDSSLNPEEKLKLLAQVCNLQQSPPPSHQEITNNLRTLSFICSLSLGSKLNHDFIKSATEEIATVFRQIALQNSLVPNLDQIENIEAKYVTTFVEKARIPGGIATYEANIRNLPPSKDLVFELARFVKSCLQGTSKEERYNVSLNPNLLAISERFPEVFENWKTSLPPIIIDSSERHQEGPSLKDLSFIPILEKELTEYRAANQKPLIETIQINLSKLSQTSLEGKEQLRLLNLIEKDLYLLDPIPMDALKALEKPISSLNTTSQKKTILVQDIDDPLTLFELPTLVSPTCQNIKAGPQTAQCLVDYAIGGNTRMIALQDSSKQFQARAVLRIFYEEEKPFLLLEPIYHSQKTSKEEATKAITEGALQKAMSLNIPLFMRDPEEDKTASTKNIDFLGGAGVFYSDSCLDESSRHIISKAGQKLTTCSLYEVTEENFERPTSGPPIS